MEQKYSWTQEFTEIEVIFTVGGLVDKALVMFVSQRDSLKVMYGDAVLVEGSLAEPVNAEETYWYVADNKLRFVLTKSKGSWWECVFKGHAKIDVSKIAESRTVSDLSTLDPEERKVVQEMMYNQKMKDAGRDVDEAKKDEILKRLAESDSGFFSNKDSEKSTQK